MSMTQTHPKAKAAGVGQVFSMDCVANTTGAADIPANLRPFQYDVYGAGAIVRSVHEALAGDVVSLVGCTVGSDLVRRIRKVVTFGVGSVDGKRCMRYVGGAMKPNGEGSHSVIATWHPDCMDEKRLCAVIGMHWRENDAVFLAREAMPPSW